jgi:hypothetical protein
MSAPIGQSVEASSKCDQEGADVAVNAQQTPTGQSVEASSKCDQEGADVTVYVILSFSMFVGTVVTWK